MSPVVLAIPAFFLFIGVEVLVARARRADVYDVGDSLCNLGTGILDQVLGAVSRGILPFTVYVLVHERWAFFSLDARDPWTWVLAFLGVDLLYYWWHRLSHEVNFMWALHAVHHQSPRFNLSVALRQNWLAGFTASPFYVPLALLGVPPAVFALSKSINLLYQFWIHTRLIGKLGPLEWLFNTPSHHRVHHGIDLPYLDRNYAGTFIVWDRLFGTFTAETRAPTYGTLKPFLGANAVWAYLQPWATLGRDALRAGSLWRGLKHLVAHPAAKPGGGRYTEAELAAQQQSALAATRAAALPLGPGRRRYLLAQLALVVLAAVAFLLGGGHIDGSGLRAAALAWIALSLVSLSLVASSHRGARWLEGARHLLLAPLVAAVIV